MSDSNINQNPPDNSWRRGCFFAFDDLCDDECADQDELLLFFHPVDVTINKKLFLMGGCSAMINFAKNFTNQPCEVIKMEKMKFAAKEVGKITYVAVGDMVDADHGLKAYLAAVYGTMQFYCKSLEHIKKQYKVRSEALAKTKEIGKELMPLFTRYQTNSLRVLPLLPNTDLPSKSKRLFIASSQVLESAKQLHYKNHRVQLGGLVTYQNGILCSSLDVEVASFVMCRIEYLHKYVYDWHSVQGQEVESPSETVTDQRIVFLNKHKISEQYPEMANYLFKYRNSQNQNSTDNNTSTEEVQDGDIEIGLYIITLGHLSVAFLMSSNAFNNDDYLKDLFQLVTADKRLQSLEQNISRSLKETTPNYKLLNQLRVPSVNDDNPSYHYIIYHNDTRIATGSSLAPKDSMFLQNLNTARQALLDDPNATMLILQQNRSGVYARRLFGREVYFQPNSTNPYDLFMEYIEQTVQKSLKYDHNEYIY